MFRHRRRNKRSPRHPNIHDSEPEKITAHFENTESLIRESFNNSPDLSIRRLAPHSSRSPNVLVAYLRTMADRDQVDRLLISRISLLNSESVTPRSVFRLLKETLLATSEVQAVETMPEILSALVSGHAVVLVDGISEALVCATDGFDRRMPEDPATEPTIGGPKEGFVESLITNVSLIRRKIRNESLQIERFTLGRVSRTNVVLAYVNTLAQDSLVAEARERISGVDVDAIQNSQDLEELIEDGALTPFPTMLRTERPDRAVAGLLEGRIVILVDGTPEALVAPVTFTMLLTSAEDYYDSYYFASAVRVLRWLAFGVSLLLPSVYVAVTTFHQELLPTPLIIAIAAQREGVPFPAAVEVLLMEILFEILREAGLRLPRIVGAAVSIIGALVLGDAAIRAGLVSPAMVVVIATTGIASFATPVFSLATAVRLLRFGVVLLAASMGFYGVVMAVFALLVHMACLRSFGTPYLSPLAPLVVSDLTDSVVRGPLWRNQRRPLMPRSKDRIRQAKKQRPSSP